jgi:hypothetical protein
VSWLAIKGARVQWESGIAADNCRISLALAARWLHLMPHNVGSDEQMFGAE